MPHVHCHSRQPNDNGEELCLQHNEIAPYIHTILYKPDIHDVCIRAGQLAKTQNTSGKIHDYTVGCSTVEQLVVGKSIHVVTLIVPSNTLPSVLHV